MLHRGVSLLHRDQGTSQVKIPGCVWLAAGMLKASVSSVFLLCSALKWSYKYYLSTKALEPDFYYVKQNPIRKILYPFGLLTTSKVPSGFCLILSVENSQIWLTYRKIRSHNFHQLSDYHLFCCSLCFAS